jgi:hypothetical protein
VTQQIEETPRLNAHVQRAAQQLIEPEPMELAFHPQELDAWFRVSGRVNSSVRHLPLPEVRREKP